jgi:hypothetical protein
MKDHHYETLGALFDGEFVEPSALSDALDAPGAAAQLVEFARLRARVRADASRPGATFYETVTRQLRPRTVHRFVRHPTVRLASAALLLVGAFMAGRQVSGPDAGKAPTGSPAMAAAAPTSQAPPSTPAAAAVPMSRSGQAAGAGSAPGAPGASRVGGRTGLPAGRRSGTTPARPEPPTPARTIQLAGPQFWQSVVSGETSR